MTFYFHALGLVVYKKWAEFLLNTKVVRFFSPLFMLNLWLITCIKLEE